jgi:PAS domain S-box-containing protein
VTTEYYKGSAASDLGGELTATHDLVHFDLSDMIRCGRSIRDLGASADSMESAAELLVRLLRSRLVDPRTGESDCVLVRCFKTHPLGKLPADLRKQARHLLPGGGAKDEVPCLTLLATAGDLEAWNSRGGSTGHAVIPLEGVEMVERAPMIAQLILQMGLEIGSVLNPSHELLIESDQRAYNVFHVENAVGSLSIPAQEFVKTHRVQSVLGFGGLLPSGDLFALILFSRAPLSRETASLFRTIALSVKLIFLPFTRGPVFAQDATGAVPRSQAHDEEHIRSEIATLRLLIPALEEAALSQTARLKGAATALELRADEVQKLGTRLSSVLESTTDAVFMLDRDWKFTYMNRHAMKLLRSQGELLGKNLWEEFPAAIDSSFWTNYQKAMREEVPVKFEEYYPKPLDRWFEVHALPSEEGLAVFFHDVTEMRLANEVLMRNEKVAAVGRLAASIAHEINNPLESVTNLIFLARNSEEIPAIQSYLDAADRELRRIAAITTQTLRFHKQSTRPAAVACSELMETVLCLYQARILNAHIQVEHRSRAGGRITCFEGDIRQVLNNLVSNALDAMPGGGRLLLRDRMATEWRTGRRGVVLTIADTGTGISARTRDKLFEAFFSTKGLNGTGLGLWISRGIVDRHDGRILLRSSQREGFSGTVFAIFLPLPEADTGRR